MKMNLSTDPWIPVVWQNGQPGMVSLVDAFERGETIRDLAVRPHERIALMRLLICIAQAALDGPVDRTEWEQCLPRIGPAAIAYLGKWQHAFELFGEKQRFLQLSLKPLAEDRVDEEEGNSVSKLDLALATGNNSTLFDNAGGSTRVFSPAQIALMLLTFQCFSPGGRIGVAAWNGDPTPGNGSSDHGPCIAGSMLHALLRAPALTETIYRNLLTVETVTMLMGENSWGQPSWEHVPTSAEDRMAVHNATATYLGRFLPLSRAVWLDDRGTGIVLANGLKYPVFDEWREPSSTVIVRQRKGQTERAVLRATLDRAPWRELHALAVRRIGRDTTGGAPALQNVPIEQPFDLWVGGLVADKAKLLDTIEAVFHMPAEMLEETGQQLYEDGVAHAETMARTLGWAVLTYRKQLGDDLTRREAREQANRIRSKAAEQYWTEIERDVQQLLDVVVDPTSLGSDGAWLHTAWGRTVRTAALRAFRTACAINTPRQMQAFVLAMQVFVRSVHAENPPSEQREAMV